MIMAQITKQQTKGNTVAVKNIFNPLQWGNTWGSGSDSGRGYVVISPTHCMWVHFSLAALSLAPSLPLFWSLLAFLFTNKLPACCSVWPAQWLRCPEPMNFHCNYVASVYVFVCVCVGIQVTTSACGKSRLSCCCSSPSLPHTASISGGHLSTVEYFATIFKQITAIYRLFVATRMPVERGHVSYAYLTCKNKQPPLRWPGA